MAFKEILVHLDQSKGNNERVAAAISLAKRQEGRVKGIALALQSTISSYVGLHIPASLTKQQQKIVADAANAQIKNFEEMCDQAGIEKQSILVDSNATKAAAQMAFYARHCDISFLGQPKPDSDGHAFSESLFEGVLFGSGRPVYVVPYFGRFDHKVRKAVIAWDGGKKAARAVQAAVPLLQERGEVTVLIINPADRSGAHGDNPGADVVAYLSRHNVDAKVEILLGSELDPDVMVLNYLADSGADLLIMGAYGHSRLREKAFGGVTNKIINQMTTPVFMSE